MFQLSNVFEKFKNCAGKEQPTEIIEKWLIKNDVIPLTEKGIKSLRNAPNNNELVRFIIVIGKISVTKLKNDFLMFN